MQEQLLSYNIEFPPLESCTKYGSVLKVYLITAHCFGMRVKEIVEVFRAMKLLCISTGIHELHVGSTGVVALQVMSPIVTMETKCCSCSVAD